MSNGTAVAFDIDAELADLQEEMDKIKDFTKWVPPAGNHDCLFDRLVVTSQESKSTGISYPVYKPFFKILDAVDFDSDTFSRWYGFMKTPGRPYQMTELLALARACNGGEEVANLKDAIDILTAASDAGDTVINVTVSHRPYMDKGGETQTATDFAYAVAAPVAVAS